MGLITLEAATNVVVPDNGLAWHKLRSNDFTDVDMSRLSEPLITLIQGLMNKNPDLRTTSNQLNVYPLINSLAELRLRQMNFFENNGDDVTMLNGEVEEVTWALGAILPERETFLYDLYNVSMGISASSSGIVSEDSMDVDM